MNTVFRVLKILVKKYLLRKRTVVALLVTCHFSLITSSAQEFFNLTADEVSIDSVLPRFYHSWPIDLRTGTSTLPGELTDLRTGTSALPGEYTVSIEYPEFIDMSASDIARLKNITDEPLPALPVVETSIGVSRKSGTLYASFVPLVFREGRYQKLVSFKLRIGGEGYEVKDERLLSRATRAEEGDSTDTTPTTEEASRYAAHSVLANGQWAKISVEETGIHQLTDALVRQCGFSNINNVKIYGYGGALQPEVLTGDYLKATDDLHEVPTYTTTGGRRLFHAVGPVSWESPTATTRTRNPYANYGYYFLTESDDEPLTIDSMAFVAAYPTNNDYHSLYEVDDYAWYHGGRHLYDSRLLASQQQNTYEFSAHDTSGKLTVVLTSNGLGTVSVAVNDSIIGDITFNSVPSSHDVAMVRTSTFDLTDMLTENTEVTLRQTNGTADMRLDYIALTMPTAAPMPSLTSTSLPTPKYVYRITNQDHHADPQADMVIIMPTSQIVGEQAQRLKEHHEKKDGLRVNLVPADELFNEYSSGTPDANAYRRYLKMLYDRATNEADMPRYLLLFGDGAWDNRLLSEGWRTTSADNLLLCYESENSMSATDCYVSDDYFCLLDDGEGGDLTKPGNVPDVGAGRLPARTAAQARILVDKILSYANNDFAGDWQNVLCFLGDDGNGNVHMREANAAATLVEENYSGYNVKRMFWDAYTRKATATGYYYPEVASLIKNQMKNGALIMDYCGHGAAYSISHEKVLLLEDFATQTSLRLPLWVTASCDIMPYDSKDDNIGETAMLNENGGSIAFYGTTRTVYTGANKDMNCGFINNVLASTDGRRNTLGDAVRLTKAEVWGSGYTAYNKLHYTLLGDPALTLAAPTQKIVIDSINSKATTDGVAQLSVGKTVTVKGHVENDTQFSGVLQLTMKDVEELIVCRHNLDWQEPDVNPYEYTDRPTTIFNGHDSISAGRFAITFSLPFDMSYSDDNCQLLAYAVTNDKQKEAHGECTQLSVTDSDDTTNDGVGPSIYCYLNSSSFTNGGNVNTTPYFYAQLSDKDGINAAGNGLGHDMELVIDGSIEFTYSLNDFFTYDFGDYRSGSLGYTLPELTEGEHSLSFRAWDVLNNSSKAELKFNVVKNLSPQCFNVECTRNPATTSTTFIVSHDRAGSNLDVVLQVFDMSGRQLWEHAENGVSATGTYTLNWDLTVSSGNRLHTGVYLYRVLVGQNGNMTTSEAKKLIVLYK